MSLIRFNKDLSDLKKSVANYKRSMEKTLSEFKQSKINYYDSINKSKIKMIKKAIKDMESDTEEKDKIQNMLYLIDETRVAYSAKEFDKIQKTVNEIANIVKTVEWEEKKELNIKLPNEIKDELNADFNEMHRCFKRGFYRATIILCGRMLETALHRKYFEATNKDLLETNPGIGLGKLIGKLKEAGIDLGPGINDQIHLINNVRISSVHKQKKTFKPSKEQANAVILYTSDALNRIFLN